MDLSFENISNWLETALIFLGAMLIIGIDALAMQVIGLALLKQFY